jgi:phage terminase large subunit-like protein
MAASWSTACLDWRERIVAKQSLVPIPPLFPDVAAEALSIFKSLRMVEAIGHPTMGKACEPFVFDFVAAIFGAQDPETGRRLINEFMMLISKKNGKSTIAAGIMLTALVLNFRTDQGLLILAPTIQIATNSYTAAASMVRADPELATILKVVDSTHTIKHLGNNAELKIIAADASVVGGTKAGFILVDELWLFGKNPKAKAIFEEATGGMAARPEGFLVYLSTHSDEPPTGIFKTKLRYFRDVRDGVIEDPSCLGVLYEWPEEMLEAEEYMRPENFYVTNPNIGKSPTVEFIEQKIRMAQAGEFDDGEDSLQIVLAKYLNVEIGLRLRRDRWRGADYWEDAADKSLTFESLLDRCEVVVVGIDGGGADDLYGLCIAGRERGTGRWLFWNRAYARTDVLDRRKDIAPKLEELRSLGEVVICDEAEFDELAAQAVLEAGGEVDAVIPPDVAEVVEYVERIRDRGLLPEKYGIGVDPAGISLTLNALNAAGISDDTIYPVGQGYRLNPAISMLPRMLKAGTARHAGQKLMDWCVSNAKATYSGSALVVSKQIAGSAKIDPLVATFNAFMLLARAPQAAQSGEIQVYV